MPAYTGHPKGNGSDAERLLGETIPIGDGIHRAAVGSAFAISGAPPQKGQSGSPIYIQQALYPGHADNSLRNKVPAQLLCDCVLVYRHVY